MPEIANPKLRPAPQPPEEERFAPDAVAYAELDVTTNFSFLRGASHADELVLQAARLGYRAIGVTDVNSLAGVVRMHDAVRQIAATGWAPRLVVGARLVLEDAPDLLVWPTDRAAYGRLCRLLTLGRRRAPKGQCRLRLEDFLEHQEGLLAAVDLETRHSDEPIDRSSWLSDEQLLHTLREVMRDRLSLVAAFVYGPDDARRVAHLAELSRQTRVPLLATNGVHYHIPERRPLQDVLTCIRHGCSIHEAGYRLFGNAERYLKSPAQMRRLFADYPQAIERGLEIARRCTFSLDELRYEYPHEVVPDGMTPIQYLRELAYRGAKERYPQGVPPKVAGLIEHELKLIEELKIEAYFLTVYDLVRFARSRGILCQGRGSAANSAVCYCIGVTSVDPGRIDVLFERFVSAARNEPPDIDIDFEHERREEVIQYIYEKYGRERAGMTATVITYRGRSAVRDVGKALGLSHDMVEQLAGKLDWWHRGSLSDQQMRDSGVDPADLSVRQLATLTQQLLGFPRHLSQHTGGMVMTRTPLCEMVPIENAAMEDRTVIEWDKDDIDAIGILKIDVLALGMLSCLSRGFRYLNESDGATERRSDEGGEGESGDGLERDTFWEGERDDDEGEDVSRSGGVAEGDGTGQAGLCGDTGDAGRGAVWADAPDAARSRLDSLKYCRRPCAPGAAGLPAIPANCAGLAGGTDDATRNRLSAEHDPRARRPGSTAERGGSNPASPDPKPGEEEVTSHDSSIIPSLRRSVAPSLRRSSPLSLRRSAPLQLHTLPPEDPAVYDMICNADTIGVFQIESRAQMSMLPRLRPRCFYDLVIEVAIVRPGPIQGNMVHPYLRRRSGLEPVTYPSEDLRQVLGKTLGVPLFQEQAMRVAMVGAGFSGAEADRLRRAMAAWRKQGEIEKFHRKIVLGMVRNGYTPEFAEQCFQQIRGFAEYGFPESHSASFALLVYASAWLKRHHPAAFACALLNSQPMGFYAPAQIVRDAKEHGVEVRAVDVNFSQWDCSLEDSRRDRGSEQPDTRSLPPQQWGVGGPALRLGFRQIKGMRQAWAEQVVTGRQRVEQFRSIEQFHRATGLPVAAVRLLAEADAFGSVQRTRRPAVWETLELDDQQIPLFDQEQTAEAPPVPKLPPMPLGQEVMTDYAVQGLSLKQHPVALVRKILSQQKVQTCESVNQHRHGRWVKVAGLVLIRQRPGTASGIVFETLEDETGIVNLILRPDIYDRYQAAARHGSLVQAEGYVERAGQVVHIMVKRMFDLTHLLAGFSVPSRDFH